jgi:hypothetical protein
LRPQPSEAIKQWQKAYSAIGGSTRSISAEKVQAALILSGLPSGVEKSVRKFSEIKALLQNERAIYSSADLDVLSAQLTAIPGSASRCLFLFKQAYKQVTQSWVTTNQANHSVALIGGAMMELINQASSLAPSAALMAAG